MKKTLMISVLITMAIIFIAVSGNVVKATDNRAYGASLAQDDEIGEMVERIVRKAKVPGVSIVLVQGSESSYYSYGYADVVEGKRVEEDTLFELGSMSKAFTGLAILLLEDQEILSLEDPVSRFIPWFCVHYKGDFNGTSIDADVDITIGDLLYHTSGIPFQTLGYIPEGNSDRMLEDTVRMITGFQLDFYPGDRYQYATVNYDILGYLIQLISGQTYEEFIQQNILSPLELHRTHMYPEDAAGTGKLSVGHKITFFSARPFEAPVYRGNTPAGYILSDAVDMERWMRIQMGLEDIPETYRRIIDKSHEGNTAVTAISNYDYAAGWLVHVNGSDIRHDGSNPGFSSMLIMQPKSQVGICVLANMNSSAPGYLAENVLNLIQDKELTKYHSDFYISMDVLFSIILIGAAVAGCYFLLLIFKGIYELTRGLRRKSRLQGVKIAGIMLAIPLIIYFGFCIYYLPNILFQRLPWNAVTVWGPQLVQPGCVAGFLVYFIFMAYVLLVFNFPRENERCYAALIPLSLINGIASAMIIFTINESFNRNLEYSKEMLVYFVFAILFFVYTLKLLQGRMIVITNEITYEKRMIMIERIMGSSYQDVEKIGTERIFSGLNNDCASLGILPEIVVGLISNILTLLFCLSYLLTKSFWAFAVSLGIILLNGCISLITSKRASRCWEQNRDIQDTYFGQMQDLMGGFKELTLNRRRRRSFWQDIRKYSRKSAELNKSASVKFLNFSLYNTLMYNIVFGAVVFLFPMIMQNPDVNQLRENLFIVFYMIGPLGAVAGAIPRLTQVNVNRKRIDRLIHELEAVAEDTFQETDNLPDLSRDVIVSFDGVTFTYPTVDEQPETDFVLGPITADFKSGETVFITGGNGSGKSTLGKLITGLYSPMEGRVLVNGTEVKRRELSDFNLFKKLYGIDYQQNKKAVWDYIDLMGLRGKVTISEEGEFASLDLSAGQRKRLAFVISCLEDKPMVLLDEWAAEQDPMFRSFFYRELLPMLKEKGKGVIVITHDDRYFNEADKMIKLERGLEI